jgi:phosphotriesterase-related protein
MSINSVTGQIELGDLGRTLIHEHVLVGFPGWFLDNRKPKFQRDEAMARVVDAFQRLHSFGVKTVVDPCPMDMGRDVEFCAEMSQKSGIKIVCTTGAYTEAGGITYTFNRLEVDAIVDIYVREIEEGIGESGIKAGAIKIATGVGKVTDYERKLLTAAARAARITGVPLISHTEDGTCGHDQIDIVTGQDVPVHQLLVGHCDDVDNPAYQLSVVERGAYIGFDRFGFELEKLVPDTIRMKNLKSLVDAGFRDRILVSHDTVACIQGGLPGSFDPDTSLIAPKNTLTHLFENIFPQLQSMGMKEEDIEHIIVENPRRFFHEASPNSPKHERG